MQKKFIQTFVFFICIVLLVPYAGGHSFSTSTTSSTLDNNISAADAEQIASAKLQMLGYDLSHNISNVFSLRNHDDETTAYVVELQPKGYVIVSADKRLPPILAYSVTHTCGDQNTDNILFLMIQHDIGARLQFLEQQSFASKSNYYDDWTMLLHCKQSTPMDATVQQWPVKGTTAYGGWLETSWTQFEPYNQFCPIDLESGERSVAGCPSIAMAGILDYHQTTNHVQLNDSDDYYHNYAGNNYVIDDDYEQYDFLSFPQLNNRLDTLVSHYQNQQQVTDEDLAALIFACGVACKQVYNPAGSGTFGVDQAEYAYLRFGFEDIDLLDDADADLYERVQANIKTGFPCHLAIVNEQSTVGHNLVLDGYRTDEYYHLNFGWGGSYDGWYLLPEEMPFEMTFIEGIIVDIVDEYDGSDLKATGALNWDQIKKGSTQTGSFTIENIGDEGSTIDWEIVQTPDWGTWTFTPDSGEDLTPEQGPFTVNVSVEVPNKRNTHYTGHITIANKDNPSDFCLVHISLTTPYLTHAHPYIQMLRGYRPLIRLIFTLLV